VSTVATCEADVLAGIWATHLPTMLERIDALERAAVTLATGTLEADVVSEAEQAAHQLAGSVGTFGFGHATDRAREAEHLLRDIDGPAPEVAPQLAQIVTDLRLQLSQAPVHTTPEVEEQHALVLLIDDDPLLSGRLKEEAEQRGMQVQTASSPAAGRAQIQRERPDVVVLDLGLGDGTDEALTLLSELSDADPRIPVLVFTVREALTDRIEVARRGAAGFLEKGLSPSDAIDQVTQVLGRTETSVVPVLAVDDDLAVLDTMRAVLGRRGLDVTTLSDPLRLWDELRRVSPDLLLLDIDMPGANGIELCRVLRNDSRWATVPVVMVTARQDRDVIRQVFEAGADDYLVKPLVSSDLIALVENRLSRSRLQRTLAETDALTGLANRRTSNAAIGQLMHLATRQGQPLCLAELDIDHFKRVNDRHGHAAGDAVLRRLGDLLRRSFRGEDVVARWGGEEFIVGMYGAPRHEAIERINELLKAFRHEEFDGAGDRFSLTFSAGVAEYPADGADLEALYLAADEALYRAKSAGRDQVLGADVPTQSPDATVDVVIVEDDEATAAVVIQALGARGYRWRHFTDGAAAVEALAGSSPELRAGVVLLDVGVPTLNGFEVLSRLAADGTLRTTRVLMLTAYTAEEDVMRALELGAADHLAKPFSVPVLMQKVGRALER
jgi:diguanylate cyclase (GGDEF)-like protein